jgi:hypothetical protein
MASAMSALVRVMAFSILHECLEIGTTCHHAVYFECDPCNFVYAAVNTLLHSGHITRCPTLALRKILALHLGQSLINRNMVETSLVKPPQAKPSSMPIPREIILQNSSHTPARMSQFSLSNLGTVSLNLWLLRVISSFRPISVAIERSD